MPKMVSNCHLPFASHNASLIFQIGHFIYSCTEMDLKVDPRLRGISAWLLLFSPSLYSTMSTWCTADTTVLWSVLLTKLDLLDIIPILGHYQEVGIQKCFKWYTWTKQIGIKSMLPITTFSISMIHDYTVFHYWVLFFQKPIVKMIKRHLLLLLTWAKNNWINLFHCLGIMVSSEE